MGRKYVFIADGNKKYDINEAASIAVGHSEMQNDQT
jgi:hypothetical protein